MNSISQLGKLRANEQANKNNNLRLPECDSSKATCKDVLTANTTANVTGIVFEDQTIMFVSAIPSTSPKLVEAEIRRILDTDFVDEDRPYAYTPLAKEVNPGLDVNHDGTALKVVHTGAGTLKQILLSTGGPIDGTRKCDLVFACVYQTSGAGAIVSVVGEAATVNLPNSPYDWSGTPATDAGTAASLATDIETALATATTKTIHEVSVVTNEEDSVYVIQILAEEGTTLDFPDLDAVVEVVCGEYYV